MIYFIVSCTLLALSPGPDNIYLFSLTLRSGKIIGFSYLAGLLLGCFLHTLILAFGLNIIVADNQLFFNIIKYLGAFYVLFLAYKTYKSKNLDYDQKKSTYSNKIFYSLKKGILMNILNPKVFLFYSLFFPNFIFSTSISVKAQILVLGIIFIICTFLVFSLIIFFSDIFHKNFKKNKNFNKLFRVLNIIILLLISAIIFFTENNITLN